VLKTSAAARMALFGPDGKTVFTGDRQGNIRVWDLAGGERRRAWQHSSAVYALVLSADGKMAATASSDPVIRLWDAERDRLGASSPR
jgi:WD40 repeat protein